MRKRLRLVVVAVAMTLCLAAVGTVLFVWAFQDSAGEAELGLPPPQDFEGERTIPGPLPLTYADIDIHSIEGEAIEIKDYRLATSEFSGRAEIVTWKGDDMYISVVTGILYEEPVRGALMVVDGQGMVMEYEVLETDTPSSLPPLLMDVTLLPDRMVASVILQGIIEVGYDGELLRSVGVPLITHQGTPLPNGNFLGVRTLYDQVVEINADGEVVWQWNAVECILPYGSDTYVGAEIVTGVANRPDAVENAYWNYREAAGWWGYEWTHANYVQKLDDGYLICLRNLDLIVKVDWAGDVVWSFGALILKHPHCARLLDNGNLLVYDNGNGRVAEFSPTSELVWEFAGLYCPALGWCEKLWNGNYLFPDTFRSRVLEVTPSGEIVKEIQFQNCQAIYQAKAYPKDSLPGLETR